MQIHMLTVTVNLFHSLHLSPWQRMQRVCRLRLVANSNITQEELHFIIIIIIIVI